MNTSVRLEALLPKLRNICSGYRINADDATWLEGLLHKSASLPEPGVVSEEAVRAAGVALCDRMDWMVPEEGSTDEADWLADARACLEAALPHLTPPTAPEAATSDHFVDANKKEAAPAGEVAYWLAVGAHGSVDFGESADDANGGAVARQNVNDWINEVDPGMRLVAVYASPQPAPAAQGSLIRHAIKLAQRLGPEGDSDELRYTLGQIAATAQQPVAADGLPAEVHFAALGVATIHVDQSYFGDHMIGPGDKIVIRVVEKGKKAALRSGSQP